jgi:uncharacterized membrane protein
MKTRVRAMGHSVHPMLVVFPLGLLTTAVVFDLIHVITGNATYAQVGFWNITAGLIGSVLAAVTGLVDWTGIPRSTRAKSLGLLHGGLNALGVVVFLIAWIVRLDRPAHDVGTGLLIVEALTIGVATAAAWMGGELVGRLGIGVDEGANPDAPSSLNGRSAGRVTTGRTADTTR